VEEVFMGDGRDEGWEFDVDDKDLVDAGCFDFFFRRGASEEGVSEDNSEREGRGTMWGWGCWEI
jgi:hypothetical protein